MTPIFLGGLLAHVAGKVIGADKDPENAEKLHRTGTLFAAGMITGEALMGILIAIPIVVTERADALALPASLQFGKLVGLTVFAFLAFWLYRTAVAKRSMP
jgi:putative exporter of polyketide antibiotics